MTQPASSWTVPPALDGARLDVAVAALADLPRNAVRRLCDARRVRVGPPETRARRGVAGDRVVAGDIVMIEGGDAWLVPGGDVEVLLETGDLVVVNKPAGIACHPLVPGEGGTVVDALVMRFPEIAAASADAREAGLVHRLDTDTSGCLAVARTRAAHERIRALFDDGAVTRRYLARVEGTVEREIVVEAPIAHDTTDPRRMIVADAGEGRDARTAARPLAPGKESSLVEVTIDRGRRHQVRVHLAHAGHPLVGDALYGAASSGGHLLHAWRLAIPGFPEVVAPPPASLTPP